MILSKFTRSVVLGFASVVVGSVVAVAVGSPAFATGGTVSIDTWPNQVTVPGGNNTQVIDSRVLFTGSITLTTLSVGLSPVVTFTNPQSTPVALPVNSAGYTECGSTGISISVVSGSFAGTCETTVVGDESRIKITFDAPYSASPDIHFHFAPGSVHFAATQNSQAITQWEAWYFADFQGGTSDSGVGYLYGQPGGTIAFDANGGSGTMDSFTSVDPTGTIPLNTFTRDGYYFDKWTTERDGTGTSYADGASYSFAGASTLYAQWGEGVSPSDGGSILANTGADLRAQLIGGAAALVLLSLGLMSLVVQRRLAWGRMSARLRQLLLDSLK